MPAYDAGVPVYRIRHYSFNIADQSLQASQLFTSYNALGCAAVYWSKMPRSPISFNFSIGVIEAVKISRVRSHASL